MLAVSSSNHHQRSGRNLADGHAIPGFGLLLSTWQTPTLGFQKQERQLRTGSTGGCLRSIAQHTRVVHAHIGMCSCDKYRTVPSVAGHHFFDVFLHQVILSRFVITNMCVATEEFFSVMYSCCCLMGLGLGLTILVLLLVLILQCWSWSWS